MNALCIIPARGGSKRIPRKNIRLLGGVPLLARAVRLARDSALFSRVLVSTDDEEIAAVALAEGALVPGLRAASLAGDHVGTSEVLLSLLDAQERETGVLPSLCCCLYPTAALVEVASLRGAGMLLEAAPACDSCLSVQAFRHPIQRALRLEAGRISMVQPDMLLKRTQDLETHYYDAGQFYWFRPEAFRRTHRLLGEHCLPLVLQAWEAVDLDNEEDWAFMERLAATKGNP